MGQGGEARMVDNRDLTTDEEARWSKGIRGR
jgi:hypothetical protein